MAKRDFERAGQKGGETGGTGAERPCADPFAAHVHIGAAATPALWFNRSTMR